MTVRRRLAAVCVMLATLTVALGGCQGNTSGGNSSGQSTEQATSVATTADGGADTTQPETADPERNEIVIAIPQDIDSLDPHTATAAGTREVLFNVYEGLVKPDENGDLIPAIASEWTISDDAREYAFTIRDGVRFHDGSEVTAEDVKYSLERCMDADSPAYQATLSIVSEVTVGDGQVIVALSDADSDFLANLTTAVIPAANTDTEGNPVGTGPYKYVSRAPQQNVILEKFDDYWNADTAAEIERVEFKVESDVNTIAMGLEAGTIDMFCRLTTEQLEQLSGAGNLEIYEGTMNLVVAVYLNNSETPFDDARVRQALSYACDPQEIMDFMFDGKGTQIGSSMFPSFAKYFDASLNDVYATDVDKAKELLADAGYADGFTFTISVPSNYDQYVDMSEILREQFARIGVTMEIQLIEWNSWLSDVYSGRQYEATIVGVDASTLTAAALLSRYQSDAHNNFVNFNSAAYDAAYKNAAAAIDDDEKTAYYKECASILTEEAANVYIMDMPSFVALNKDFTGYAFYPLYVQDIARIRLAK